MTNEPIQWATKQFRWVDEDYISALESCLAEIEQVIDAPTSPGNTRLGLRLVIQGLIAKARDREQM